MPTRVLKTVTVEGKRVGRPTNAELRPREYLTEGEIERLCAAARKRGRYGHRDATMILVAYRHGLRVSELISLRWDQVDFTTGHLQVKRLKGSLDGVHPLSGSELRALRRLNRESEPGARFVFTSERDATMTRDGFSKMLGRAAHEAELEIKVHPHMLRHGCGFYLANRGTDTRTIQQYLGHKDINHTVRYTELAPGRFNNLWQD